MTITLLNTRSDAERIRAIWHMLNSSQEVSYFLSVGWVENWLATLPEDVSVSLAVISQAETPVGAFFIGKSRVVRKRVFRSQAVFLNTTGMPEYDALCIEYNGIPLTDGHKCDLMDIIESLPIDWDEIFFPALDSKAFPANSLDTLRPPYVLVVDKVVPSPYVDLQSVREAKDGYISLLSANTRQQIRRSYRRYQEKGPLNCRAAANAAEAHDMLAELIRLHQATWMARGKPGAFASAYFRKFHERLIETRFHTGEIQLLRISFGNTVVGYLYNFIFRRRVLFYQSGLAYTTDPHCKPGLVCHVEAVRVNAEAGNLTYDFLGGESRYKLSLATHQNRLIWVRIQKPRMKFKIERKLRAIKQLLIAWRSSRKQNIYEQ
ncbi:MAG: GNAT family N-acetyltransferase [Verrucomicrobiae bacterium]|nr:GNAT family N-acetyltransferase [Verrucomicrobiae bacterium]